MEESLRRSRALCDLLMKSKQEAKDLAGSVLTSKTLRLQTVYMGTRRTNVTVHGVPIDISEDRLGAFFALYGKVEKVTGIATGDVTIEITLTRKNFIDIPNILMCRERRMIVVVEGRRPYC